MLGLARERLGASGVQLGRKVVLEGQEIIEYIAASEGQADIVGRVRTIAVYVSILVLDIERESVEFDI